MNRFLICITALLMTGDPAGAKGRAPLSSAALSTTDSLGLSSSGCFSDETTLCLGSGDALSAGNGRFQVEVSWRDFNGTIGTAKVVPADSDDSGLFWFFDPGNWEMLVKVLDGCAVNGHFWVFAAATTNVEYTMTVTDVAMGVVKQYFNPLGEVSPAITDTGALATCPTNQVPTLTNDTTAVSSSGIFSSSYKAWYAFDGSNSSMWISEVFETPAWIAYDWGSSDRLISHYKITNTNGSSLTSRAPKEFTLQGWDDNRWVTLDTRTNQTGWVSGTPRTYRVSSPGFFSKYRLHITDDNDSRSGVVVISIGNLEFIGY